VNRRHARARRGFTMLTVLWVMSVAAAIAMTGNIAGRATIDAAVDRVEVRRARWLATGCARRAQASIDLALIDANTRALTWRTLATAIADSPVLGDCELHLEASGTRIDLNSATEEMYARLFSLAGVGGDPAALAANVIAARDTAAFADAADLSRVAGLSDHSAIDSLVSIEEGRVSLASATSSALRAVPGITAEAAAAIVARRVAGNPIADLSDILGAISESAADSLLQRFPDAVRLTTAQPDAWIIHARARAGVAGIAQIDFRVVLSPHGATVARITEHDDR
jgi:DNA uptake protein ComE-like DNA-binding protein